jgi:hypothetical protein
MLDYSQLPGLLAERFFYVLDTDKDLYLNQKEFLNGMLDFYCSSFDQKLNSSLVQYPKGYFLKLGK